MHLPMLEETKQTLIERVHEHSSYKTTTQSKTSGSSLELANL